MTMDDSIRARNNDSHPAEDVATLKLQLELEKLDRQWVEEKQPYLPYENVNVPFSYFMGFLIFALPIFFIGWGLSNYAEGQKPDKGLIVVGIFFLVGSVVVWMYHSRKNRLYNEAKQRYEERRQQLLQEIAASREKANARDGND
jgi:hypothetical protein